MAARKRASVQAITPEEPPTAPPAAKLEDSARAPARGGEPCGLDATRSLESALAEAIAALERDAPLDRRALAALLNRSLTAISHWSLQAQLSQLENRAAWDSRLAVENNLIKKEVEFFRNRCLNERRLSAAAPAAAEKRVAKARAKKPEQPSLLRLVENNKPHPRMRRSSDNPSANEFVRVFHLEKL
ncbi:LAFE_0B03884g1_1 [Lachancea fermentati]|uniref:LAFE_0B03884g1_1 n=1 Tax=Lachancea fermentati TaxID=4955 RepID=A0A1G4M7N2_LACFM|nr:LAFE_0B03884g1_1 [Lachancea fermentati]